jgi:hypothetical protein
VGVLIKRQKLNHARNGRPHPPFRLRWQAIFIRSASFARASGDYARTATAISAAVMVSTGTGKNKKFQIALGLIKRRAEESAPFRETPSNKDTAKINR